MPKSGLSGGSTCFETLRVVLKGRQMENRWLSPCFFSLGGGGYFETRERNQRASGRLIARQRVGVGLGRYQPAANLHGDAQQQPKAQLVTLEKREPFWGRPVLVGQPPKKKEK